MHVNTSPDLTKRICKEDNQSLIFRPGGKEGKNRDTPGDSKPLVTSQSPQKVSIQITLYQRLQKRQKRKQRLSLLFKRVNFLKIQLYFLFFSSPLPVLQL